MFVDKGVTSLNDEQYMRFALKLAAETAGHTSPNPAVGAVIVKKNKIVGFGAHIQAGEDHAEAHALRMAGCKAEGATMYVTLEPCSHQGKVPPCTQSIIERGIQRVVIATLDANENVHGQGVERLRNAGIEVVVGVLQTEARELNAPFFHFIRTKKPFVTMKTAMSLDGKIATHMGDSQWITGEDARLDGHTYRHTHDAILVGVNTVLADDSSLTTRIKGGGNHPVRVILDTHLRTPLDAKVITDGQAKTWIFVGCKVNDKRKQPFEAHPHVTIFSLEDEKIDIHEVLTILGKNDVMSLFVEGGARVNGTFLQEQAFNQVIVYIAPKLIGGRQAPTPFAGEGFSVLSDVPSLRMRHVEKMGNDLKIIATLD